MMKLQQKAAAYIQYLPHIVALCVVALALALPNVLVEWMTGFTQGFLHSFDWLVLLTSTGFLVMCVYLILSRYGRITLGVDGEEPHFSTISWLAMLFAAGMGAGLVFWGSTEPLQHMMHPPTADIVPGSEEAVRMAFTLTNFHWALHPWAIYGFCSLAVAYFTFRKKQPLLVSAPMRATKHPTHAVEAVIDTIALLAIVFGVVASLGQGVLQVTGGLGLLFDGFAVNNWTYALVLGVLAACYMLSASGGINKGIKPLSDLNMLICVLLLLYVLFTGPTTFLMQNMVSSFGHYLSNLMDLSFNLRRLDPEGNQWTQTWTLTYFLWWVAWGPFVGVFIARISRGRTIREFLIGVMIVPAVFSVVWFTIFGGVGVYMDMNGSTTLADARYSMTTYRMLAELPWPHITQGVALVLVFVFLVTSADSGTYVLGMFSTKGNPNPPKRHRLFWGVIIALMTLGALLTGQGVDVLRAFVALGGIPFLFIMIWQGWCLLRSLKQEQIPYRERPKHDKEEKKIAKEKPKQPQA